MMRMERMQEQLQLQQQRHLLGVRRVESLAVHSQKKEVVLRALSVTSALSRPRNAAALLLP